MLWRSFISLILIGCLISISITGSLFAQRIQVDSDNPSYWNLNGEPVILIGGSVEDNLFQLPDVETHLELLSSVGGNYVRNTMSSRDEGNIWAFVRDRNSGLYDLNQPNEAYWDRFKNFLDLTARYDIVVQIEVWATFDFYDDRDMRRGFWQKNPFNPKNNVNYSASTSGLPEIVDSHPTQTNNPFFFTVTDTVANRMLLNYQKAFVDRILEISLPYGHVLYCMDNETSVTPQWGAYWARYIRRRAAERNVTVQTTEMWDPWDLAHEMHANTFDHPEYYSFVDISQNNHQTGQDHWDNAQRQRARISATGSVRPLNNVKIYGADTGRFGTTRDGIERFWRNLLGGMASARFHRPDSGIGLSDLAQANLKSARMLMDAFDLVGSEPSDNLLTDREENEAYVTAQPGQAYAVFFTDGGSVRLEFNEVPNEEQVTIRWLNISESTWALSRSVPVLNHEIILVAPGVGYWVAVIEV